MLEIPVDPVVTELKCGEIEFRMTEGSDEFVQLEALLSQFTLVGS